MVGRDRAPQETRGEPVLSYCKVTDDPLEADGRVFLHAG